MNAPTVTSVARTRFAALFFSMVLGTLGVVGSVLAAPALPVIVLVHGALTDGSAWKGVYDILVRDGFQVRIVQQPLTGLAQDVAATRRVLDLLEGPVVLVGHSYGGTVITVAGTDPKVRALVYVSALQPDVGETTGKLSASMPGRVANGGLRTTADGFISYDPARFAEDVAADVPPQLANFLANAQMPIAASAFEAVVPVAAWRAKPSYAIVATEDLELNPVLAHFMYSRSGAKVTEIPGSHMAFVARPGLVAQVIEVAARVDP